MAVLGVTLVAMTGCVGEQDSGNTTDAKDGPLEFPTGLKVMLAAHPEETFNTFAACGTDQDEQVRLVSLEPLEVTGTSEIEFAAAWLGPGEDLRRGAGPRRLMESPFGPAEDSSGIAERCSLPESTFEIAVLLPRPTDTAIVVEGVRVVYEIGGDVFREVVNVTFGVCATAPADADHEPEECQQSAGGTH